MKEPRDLAEAGLRALRRAARNAYEEAARWGLKVPVSHKGKIIHMEPKVLLRNLDRVEATEREQREAV